jgi:hypothetical protein
MKRWALSLILVLSLAATVAAQSRRKYDHFYIELNKSGKAVALVFQEGDSVGCSGITSANGTITSVDWDIVVNKFTIRFNTGTLSVFVPDDLDEIANADRGLLSDVFRKGNRVRMTWRECGSGNIPDLIGVKVLR